MKFGAYMSLQGILSSESIPNTARCSVAAGVGTEVTVLASLVWMFRGHMALEITIKGGPILAVTDVASDGPVVALLSMPAE